MNAPDWPWFAYWLIVFGGLAFGVAEAVAIRSKRRGATLSANVHWTTKRIPYGAHLLVAFMALLAWHFTAGGGHRWDIWNWRPWRRGGD